ncbi:MAG: 4Fe-4S dicluster domain-containing protein [Thermodesulfobacteriota bacterium]
MKPELLQGLQRKLDTYSMGFPATASGIENKILTYLFSEDDAEMFLAMTPQLETPEAVAARLGQPVDHVAARLDSMAERGLLFRTKKGAVSKYGAIPFVHGLFEFQVKNLKKDLAEMVEQYFDEAFDAAMQNGAEYFLRPIPVMRSIEVRHQVASYDDAKEILKTKPQIVITDCICRKSAQTLDKSCGKHLEACFMFGSMGQYYLDRGMGREISLEEATKILEKCAEQGLVTQPATAQNPGGMCNCCGDCCGVLKALNKHPRPAELVMSNRVAVVSADDCTGCETCLDRCQMNAIEVADGLARVKPERCIGCGLCVITCPTEALGLQQKPGEEPRVPPVSMMEQMMQMARKRGVI